LSTTLTFALLVLVASAASAHAQPSPDILFGEAPALLVRIEGAPVYRPIAGTDLERIVNTQVLLVRDPSGIHYLKARDGWMESYELNGDWTPSGVSPFGENTTTERVTVASAADLLKDPSASLDDDAPTIFVVTRPAALILTDGPPRYETVPGTSLRYLANTRAMVFREPSDTEFYVRVDGQWYCAWTTDGPWQSIPANQLPADIARRITP
jgi:hypothetical protein